jgi:hypothetical protein
MVESAALADAIRAGGRLRDKVIVVAVEASWDGDRIDAVAADLAAARAFGAKVLAVAAVGPGPLPLDAQGPAVRLHAALARHEERGVLLPASGIVTVQRTPVAARAPATPAGPSTVPVVNDTLLIYLLALKYVPIVFAPAVDAAGAAVELAAGTLGAFVAHSTGAALLLVAPASVSETSAAASGLPPLVALPPGGVAVATIVGTEPSEPGRLLADILRHAPSIPAAPTAATAPTTAAPATTTSR